MLVINSLTTKARHGIIHGQGYLQVNAIAQNDPEYCLLINVK
jgi:hypothetical protein